MLDYYQILTILAGLFVGIERVSPRVTNQRVFFTAPANLRSRIGWLKYYNHCGPVNWNFALTLSVGIGFAELQTSPAKIRYGWVHLGGDVPRRV